MRAAWETATTDPDPLVALGATRALAELLMTWEAKLASEAMEKGETWETIGGSVGVSRQAAWERLHREVDEFKRQVKKEARALGDRHRDEVRQMRIEFKQQLREEILKRVRDSRRSE
jgi:hypothetical protein